MIDIQSLTQNQGREHRAELCMIVPLRTITTNGNLRRISITESMMRTTHKSCTNQLNPLELHSSTSQNRRKTQIHSIF